MQLQTAGHIIGSVIGYHITAHHTSSVVAPLATSPATNSVQVGGSGPQVSQQALQTATGSATTGPVLARRQR